MGIDSVGRSAGIVFSKLYNINVVDRNTEGLRALGPLLSVQSLVGLFTVQRSMAYCPSGALVSVTYSADLFICTTLP